MSALNDNKILKALTRVVDTTCSLVKPFKPLKILPALALIATMGLSLSAVPAEAQISPTGRIICGGLGAGGGALAIGGPAAIIGGGLIAEHLCTKLAQDSKSLQMQQDVGRTLLQQVMVMPAGSYVEYDGSASADPNDRDYKKKRDLKARATVQYEINQGDVVFRVYRLTRDLNEPGKRRDSKNGTDIWITREEKMVNPDGSYVYERNPQTGEIYIGWDGNPIPKLNDNRSSILFHGDGESPEDTRKFKQFLAGIEYILEYNIMNPYSINEKAISAVTRGGYGAAYAEVNQSSYSKVWRGNNNDYGRDYSRNNRNYTNNEEYNSYRN